MYVNFYIVPATKLNKMVKERVMSEIKKQRYIKVTTKAFTKTLQEYTLKSTDNHLNQYLSSDRGKFIHFKLKDG